MSLTNHIGQSTTYTSILPSVGRIHGKKLSRGAKWRLGVLDFYFTKSNRSVSLTSRRFGVSRAFIYKWLKRYNPKHLGSLEDKSRRPHHFRDVTYDTAVVGLVRSYREDKDTAVYSARKLAQIFRRDYEDRFHISSSTIGRIISRFKLFFTEVVKVHRKRSERMKRFWSEYKQRKPYNLALTTPRTVIEFDMKHVYAHSVRYYAFCAIDPYTKESLVHVAKNASSHQAKLALEKVIARFGRDITILNDNGGENMGQAWEYLEQQRIVQYFARPHTPKDKPYVERLIGTYQRECLDQRRDEIHSIEDLEYFTARWINNYHYLRPHDSLGGLTPDEFCATLGITIKRAEVSTM